VDEATKKLLETYARMGDTHHDALHFGCPAEEVERHKAIALIGIEAMVALARIAALEREVPHG
jgi:hypothetical protein